MMGSKDIMRNSMKVGVAIEETWAFFRDIYADLQANYQVHLFENKTTTLPLLSDRVNRYYYQQGLQNLLQKNEVVFFEWASELLASASQLPKTCGIVARLHRYEMYRWIDKINWEVVDHLILVSEAKRDEFLSHVPQMASRVSVIPEAVSLERFTTFEKPFTGDIGTLCSLIPRKRVYELILAFAQLQKEFPAIRLHIAGPEREIFAEYAQALYRLTQRLNLAGQVIFYGKVDEPEKWYRNLDIFISNSYSEGLQVSLLEAMASGVYSLSHYWEGAEEILPPENLYFSEGELIKLISRYMRLSEEQRVEEKIRLTGLVAGKSNSQNTIQAIRQVIDQVGSTWRTRAPIQL